MSDVFVCKGSRLTAFLLTKGCRCFKVDVDKVNKNYTVHLFDKDDKCKAALLEWENKIK